jgi:hypothetical protein
VVRSPLGTSRWIRTPSVDEGIGTLAPLYASGRYFSLATGALLEIIELDEGEPALVLPKQEPRALYRVDEGTYVASPLWLRFTRDGSESPTLLLSEPRCLDVRYTRLENVT